MSTSVSWLQFNTDAPPVHASVSWLDFDTRAATIHASVSWLQFNTRARTADTPGGRQRRHRSHDYDDERIAVLRRNDESLLMALAAIVVARRYQ